PSSRARVVPPPAHEPLDPALVRHLADRTRGGGGGSGCASPGARGGGVHAAVSHSVLDVGRVPVNGSSTQPAGRDRATADGSLRPDSEPSGHVPGDARAHLLAGEAPVAARGW